MAPRRETDFINESGDKNQFSWVVESTVGTAKSKLLQFLWLVIKPSSPTSRISFSNPNDAERKWDWDSVGLNKSKGEIAAAAAVVENGR